MLETLLDFLTNILAALVIGIITSAILVLVKKGNFYRTGVNVGKYISVIGRLRFGRLNWEKIEDVLINVFVSFGSGIKDGANLDDN